MDLERLSEFITLAEAGSIKSAAAELGLAPNVLSTRLKSFENSLGTTLIERNAHTFRLTDSGRILIKDARDILDSYGRAITSLSEIRGTSFKRLKIMLCAQTMPMDLGIYLDIYCREHSELFLGLYDENSCRIRSGLQSGAADIVFAIGRENDFEDIEGRIVLSSYPKMRVHIPNDHRLAGRRSIRFSELSGETFILYPNMTETHTRDLQYSMLEQAGIRFDIYQEDYSPFFYDLLVPIGCGVRPWNWTERQAPNSSLVTISDEGYETYMYMLFDPSGTNGTVGHFINSFLKFREERR